HLQHQIRPWLDGPRQIVRFRRRNASWRPTQKMTFGYLRASWSHHETKSRFALPLLQPPRLAGTVHLDKGMVHNRGIAGSEFNGPNETPHLKRHRHDEVAIQVRPFGSES